MKTHITIMLLFLISFHVSAQEIVPAPVWKKQKVKEPALAAVLCIIPGGGQYYNEQVPKGLLFTGMFLTGIIIDAKQTDEWIYDIFTTGKTEENDSKAGSILIISSYVLSVTDAIFSAVRINKKARLKMDVQTIDVVDVRWSDKLVPSVSYVIPIK